MLNSQACSKCLVVFILSFCLLLYYRIAWCNMPVSSLEFKTPPNMDYILFGLIVSLTLLKLENKLSFLNQSRFLRYIGSNTMWIYYWHIPIVLIMNSLISSDLWLLKYFLTLVLSISLYSIQYKLINHSNKQILKKYLIG